jgi:hypothetical protein
LRIVGVVVGVGLLVAGCTARTGGDATSSGNPPPAVPTEQSTVDTNGIDVGDRIGFTDRSPADVEIAEADCAEPEAVYEVAAVRDSPDAGCPPTTTTPTGRPATTSSPAA